MSTGFMDTFPFIIPKDSLKTKFVHLSHKRINLNNNRNDILYKFQLILERKFEKRNLTKKLQEWYLLSFKDFINELFKQKVKLSLSEETEWTEFFNSERIKALDVMSEIEKTDKEIDQMVYKLYELTEEEIKIVEES